MDQVNYRFKRFKPNYEFGSAHGPSGICNACGGVTFPGQYSAGSPQNPPSPQKNEAAPAFSNYAGAMHALTGAAGPTREKSHIMYASAFNDKAAVIDMTDGLARVSFQAHMAASGLTVGEYGFTVGESGMYQIYYGLHLTQEAPLEVSVTQNGKKMPQSILHMLGGGSTYTHGCLSQLNAGDEIELLLTSIGPTEHIQLRENVGAIFNLVQIV